MVILNCFCLFFLLRQPELDEEENLQTISAYDDDNNEGIEDPEDLENMVRFPHQKKLNVSFTNYNICWLNIIVTSIFDRDEPRV